MLANSAKSQDNAELSFLRRRRLDDAVKSILHNSHSFMKGMMKMARTDLQEKLPKILRWIEEGQSKAYMARELDCSPNTIARFIQKQGIEYAGNQSGKG